MAMTSACRHRLSDSGLTAFHPKATYSTGTARQILSIRSTASSVGSYQGTQRLLLALGIGLELPAS
jgi:hypothetical protein